MMDDESMLVERFCHAVNERLARGQYTLDALPGAQPDATDGEGDSLLLDRLRETAQQAIQPGEFINQRVIRPGLRFEQCDALLRIGFDPAEIEPKERFIRMLGHLSDPTHMFPFVLVGRFWRVSGLQLYDEAGRLASFDFDPLTVTEGVAAVVAGHYMSMQPIDRPRSGVGALGNLVTREAFRGGHGHGSALTTAFEREAARIAESRGERLDLYILESQVDSQGFWYKQGYRWPLDTRYAQPPLEFDPVSGERLHDEVPETLMVKIPGNPDAMSVDADLLTDAVRIMYRNWCLAETRHFPPAAARRAEEYVMDKVLGDFRASLPANGEPVPLAPPPALREPIS